MPAEEVGRADLILVVKTKAANVVQIDMDVWQHELDLPGMR